MYCSFEINGKFWILPDGSVLDVNGDEHARFARAAMLGIPFDRMKSEIPLDRIFFPISKEEGEKALKDNPNLDPEAIRFLVGNGSPKIEPRLFAIEKLGWIRTRESKFYVWERNPTTISCIINSKDFWSRHKKVNEKTWMDFVEISNGVETGGRYGYFLNNFGQNQGAIEC